MACWVTVTLEDGTEEEINLDHIVRIKRQKNDGKKTLLFEVGGNSTWCMETVEEIRSKRVLASVVPYHEHWTPSDTIV